MESSFKRYNKDFKLNNNTLNKDFNLNELEKTHPKQVISLENKLTKEEKADRFCLYVYNISFSYKTQRGSIREDRRIIITNDKIIDIEEHFKYIMQIYNQKYPYRAFNDINVISSKESNISDIEALKELYKLDYKEKSRILINESKEGVITLNKININYKTDRGANKESIFIMPLVGYKQKRNLTNIEIQNLINENKRRKISNVKILDIKHLTFIKL